MSPWTPIAVAIAGAIVSIIAAFLANHGATNARKSAEALNSRAHRIARLDVESEELREAFKAFVSEFGKFASTKEAAPVLAALEVIMACQGATPALEKAATRCGSGVFQATAFGDFDGTDPQPVRIAYKEAQKIIADKREAQSTDRK